MLTTERDAGSRQLVLFHAVPNRVNPKSASPLKPNRKLFYHVQLPKLYFANFYLQ